MGDNLFALIEASTKFVEQTKLEGTWIVVSDVWNGQQPESSLKNAKVRIKGNSITLNAGTKKAELSTYKVFPSMKPRGIDMINESGGVFRSIYRLNGDQLEICQPLDRTAKRPTAFESTADSGTMLLKLKRITPAANAKEGSRK